MGDPAGAGPEQLRHDKRVNPERNQFNQELEARLEALRLKNLFRELRTLDSPQAPAVDLNGRAMLNFSSNDYLGLANHPLLKEAAVRALERFGVGAGASRLISGTLAPHHELEQVLAQFKGTEAALSFSSGYATALGTIPALVGRDDIVILDKLVHACMVDATRLSGARVRVCRHNDIDHLEELLRWADAQRGAAEESRILVLTESVFSMDGDRAPLRDIVELKNRFRAWLMVDEAHALGLFGRQGRGCAEELGVSNEIEIQMGTLGKAVGAAGGYICGSQVLIDFLVNASRSFIFSTAPVPAAAASALAGIRLISSPDGDVLRRKLWENVNEFRAGIRTPMPDGAILPLHVGDEAAALEFAGRLRAEGFLVPAIRYPTVARGRARLRITMSAAHNLEQVRLLTAALRRLHPQANAPGQPATILPSS